MRPIAGIGTEESRAHRRGAAAVEAALVLGVFALIVLGMLDLGLALFHYNTIAEGARRVARQAILRGERSAPESTPWGPMPYEDTADASSEVSTALRPALVITDPGQVTVRVEWPDGENRVGQRIRVTVRYPHQPLFPLVTGGDPINLEAVSTMRIAH